MLLARKEEMEVLVAALKITQAEAMALTVEAQMAELDRERQPENSANRPVIYMLVVAVVREKVAALVAAVTQMLLVQQTLVAEVVAVLLQCQVKLAAPAS